MTAAVPKKRSAASVNTTIQTTELIGIAMPLFLDRSALREPVGEIVV